MTRMPKRFRAGRAYVFPGEIPNMSGHCVVADRLTGRLTRNNGAAGEAGPNGDAAPLAGAGKWPMGRSGAFFSRHHPWKLSICGQIGRQHMELLHLRCPRNDLRPVEQARVIESPKS